MSRIQTSIFEPLSSVQTIAAFLFGKEQYILDTFPFVSYFGTDDPAVNNPGNFVTTRSGTYNVFHFANECPELISLKTFLASEYSKYLDWKGYRQYLVNPAINCWLNVVRKGESISFHKHSSQELSFVSGSMVLQCDSTNTWYKFDDGEVERTPNLPGAVTVFPCNAIHWTDMHFANEPRITIGFDFFYNKESAIGNPTFYNALVSLENF